MSVELQISSFSNMRYLVSIVRRFRYSTSLSLDSTAADHWLAASTFSLQFQVSEALAFLGSSDRRGLTMFKINMNALPFQGLCICLVFCALGLDSIDGSSS